ncbi:DUF1501 domain-containing protein [Aurantibacter aestuarii]|uniref:Twin-arginine translocation pathway signal n=1 Tax=Aurantibacter aestuarii TaxID=1266046 RepID=A0A2T1NDM0_9FLAO|nr:DUF1501 domain-containing protein [Aurantibacter aestuarii]PSG90520.1 twin-arginine translocation pathway signal [Aurantibacter aestuarii]
MKRRDFLKNSALASSVMFAPSFVNAANNLVFTNTGQKRLVIIQLSGGNDGLNTVIPVDNDIYYKNRPNISIEKNKALHLSDTISLNPNLIGLQKLYDKGNLCIINNVGYPNPDRSHFRSTDIWQTASDSNQFFKYGWVGRYLDQNAKFAYQAIELDDSLSLALKGKELNGIATKNPEAFFKASNDPFFNQLLRQKTDVHLSEHNLGYLYKTMTDAKSSAKYINEKNTIKDTRITYPNSNFGKQLKTTANLINSNINTQIFYTSLDGFDTHVNQEKRQGGLLKTYAECLEVFVNDLKQNGTFKDTLILTFSEFGRRVSQNAAKGTDHGAANNVFVVGDELKKQGFYNDLATLEDLDDNGDIKYDIDFREIYATILNKWLNVDDTAILIKKFNSLDFI